MVVFEEVGSFAPSRLFRLLVAAGVDVAGVTNTDTAVQIICQEGTSRENVEAVLAAYPHRVLPNDAPTQNLVAAVKAVVGAADFAHAQANLQAIITAMAG